MGEAGCSNCCSKVAVVFAVSYCHSTAEKCSWPDHDQVGVSRLPKQCRDTDCNPSGVVFEPKCSFTTSVVMGYMLVRVKLTRKERR